MNQKSTQSNCLFQKLTISAVLFAIMIMISAGLQAQSSKEYTSAESDALMTDMTAGTYDVYELSTAGGTYILNGTLSQLVTFTKNITIKAKTGLATKPVIQINGASTSSTAAVFVLNAPDLIFKLEGIEFNGVNLGAGSQPMLVRSLTTAINCQVIVKDCNMHDFLNAAGNGTIRLEGSYGTSMDIRGTTFNNCGGRILFFNSADGNSTTNITTVTNGDFTLKDCTFSNINAAVGNANAVVHYKSSSGIWAKGVNATIDHCTFYNLTLTSDEIFKFRLMSGVISIKNCIFDQVGLGITFASPAPTIEFCYLAGFASPPTGSNTITATPLYTNASTLNFGLTNRAQFVGSDALTVGNTIYYSVVTAIPDQFQVNGKENINFKIYPNPSARNMTFDYKMQNPGKVNINVYNLNNQLVKSFINNEPHDAGSYSRSYDVSDLKPGVYFVRLSTGATSKTVKVVVKK